MNIIFPVDADLQTVKCFQLHKKYWIVNGNAATRGIFHSCVTCRKRNAKVQQQMMGELPRDRVTPDEPPFTRVGMLVWTILVH